MDKPRQQLLEKLMEKIDDIMKQRHAMTNFPFADFKLSRVQFLILFYIAPKKEGATINEIAKFLRVTPSAVTQFVDILVKKKLVTRQVDLNDRRVISVNLTSPAKKQFANFKKEYFKNIGGAFSNLSLTELEQFINLISKIKTPS